MRPSVRVACMICGDDDGIPLTVRSIITELQMRMQLWKALNTRITVPYYTFNLTIRYITVLIKPITNDLLKLTIYYFKM